MDSRINGLRTALDSAAAGLMRGRHDTLMRSLEAAAEAYAATNEAAKSKSAADKADADNARAQSAFAALVAVMDHLRDERLDAPFRYLFDHLEKSQRGRRTKPLEDAQEGARLAAAVDDLMEQESISLDEACKRVANAAGYSAKYRRKGDTLTPAGQLKELRESIRRGKARPEAVELYKILRRPDKAWAPNDERPAPYLKRPKRARSQAGTKGRVIPV